MTTSGGYVSPVFIMNDDGLICLKGQFAFRLATTSYIVPETIVPNLRLLGPLFDEVELVLFDSAGAENLPSVEAITEMAAIGCDLGYTYNVHLPTDIFLGSADDRDRWHARETILQYYERTLPLNPTSYILHFEKNPETDGSVENLSAWRHFLRSSVAWLLDQGIPREMIAVENIDYPFSWVDLLVEEFDLKVCLDLGHLIVQKANIPAAYNRYGERITMMHLHGSSHRDHQSVSLIDHDQWQEIGQILRDFRGGLSIEVFSLENLRSSLQRMAELI